MAAGTIQNSIEVWCSSNGKVICHGVGHTGSIFCVKFEHGFLYSGSDDRSIRKWALPKSRESKNVAMICAAEFWGHKGRVWSVETMRNFLISGGEDGIFIWNIQVSSASSGSFTITDKLLDIRELRFSQRVHYRNCGPLFGIW